MDEELNKAEMDDFSLIDVSNSDDDFLFASSSDVSIVDSTGFAEAVPVNQPFDSLGLHKPKKYGKCNLRKSLAWDSAFFTNAGVLDPEELSSIIEGTETGVKQSSFLPGIQEDLSKSTDSISTFQSDLTLESIEADLFSDIRASIQKCSKSSTTGNSRGSKIHGKDKSIIGSSTKLPEPSARKLATPKSASNRLNSGIQGSMRTLKPCPVGKQEKPPVNRSKEPSSLLSRLPKAAGQSNSTTKRMSVGTGRAKQDTNAVGIVKGKGSSLPEASHQVNSRKPLPKAPVSSKISAPSVLNKTVPRSSRSSCDSSSGSSTSENVRKSQTGVIRRKMEKSVNLPSLSKTRNSSKAVDKAIFQNKESHLSEFVKSSSNLSPSVSPTSSISEWSVESSSSTATVNQKHFGLSTLPSSHDGALGGHDEVAGVKNQSLKQPSTGSVFSTRPGFAKPSGLRMPSPNNGFFDGVKAGVRTPNSSSRSRTAVPSSLPRSVSGTHSASGTNKSKLGTSAPRPKQKIIDANSKTAALHVDHCVDLTNPSGAKHTDNDSETSSEIHGNTSPNSALERTTPEVSRLETHVPESWLVGEDNLGSALIAVDISSKSSLEKDDKFVSSVDSELVGKDNLALELVSATTEDAPKPALLSDSSKLTKGYLSMSVLEKDNEVTYEEEQALELASMVKDVLVASDKKTRAEENLLITTGTEIFITKNELEGDPLSTDPNVMLTIENLAEDSGNTCELSKSTSQYSARKSTETEIFDGKDDILHSNVLPTIVSEDGSHMSSTTGCVEIPHVISISNIEEKNLNIVDNVNDLTLGSVCQHTIEVEGTPQVNDADNLGSVCQHTIEVVGRDVGSCADDENQCVVNERVEIKENSYTANYDGEIQDYQEEANLNVQSLSEKFSSLILNSPLPSSVVDLSEKFSSLILNSPLPSSVVDPAARTPLAIKNSESNVVEINNSPTG